MPQIDPPAVATTTRRSWWRRPSQRTARPGAEGEPAGPVDLTDATFPAALGGRISIIDFWAPWCPPCRALHPLFEEAARRHRDAPLNFARLEVDANPAVSSTFAVMSIPTLLMCDGEGNELDRLIGVPDRRTLDQFVQRALDRVSELP